MATQELTALLDTAAAQLAAIAKTSGAILTLARSMAGDTQARAADPDEWTRMPPPGRRCKISGWSRSTVERRPNVRKKTVMGCRYYSLTDVRAALSAR